MKDEYVKKEYRWFSRLNLWWHAQFISIYVEDAIHAVCPNEQTCPDDILEEAIGNGIQKGFAALKKEKRMVRRALWWGIGLTMGLAGFTAVLAKAGVPAALLGSLGYITGTFFGPRIMAKMAPYFLRRTSQDQLASFRMDKAEHSLATPRVVHRFASHHDSMQGFLSTIQQLAHGRLNSQDLAIWRILGANANLSEYLETGNPIRKRTAEISIAQALFMMRNNFPDIFSRVVEGKEHITIDNMREQLEPFFETASYRQIKLDKTFWNDFCESIIKRIKKREGADFYVPEVRLGYVKMIHLLFAPVVEYEFVRELIYRNGNGNGRQQPEQEQPLVQVGA